MRFYLSEKGESPLEYALVLLVVGVIGVTGLAAIAKFAVAAIGNLADTIKVLP
jgi:hypothetical protein